MSEYIPVLLMFTIAILMAAVIPMLSLIWGPRKPTRSKLSVYECGLKPVGNARDRFSVKFYLIAILFIIFDIEIVFMYPWALCYAKGIQDGLGLYLFVEMAIFFFVLTLGLLYGWRKGVLDWSIKKGAAHD